MTKQQLYEKYKYLIYKVLKDTNCKPKNEDEWQEYYGYGEIGLIKAINTFDINKNDTSTYFYTCIKNDILVGFKYRQSEKRKINFFENTSLNKEIGEGTELQDLLLDKSINIEEEIIKQETNSFLYKAINMLKPTYKQLICDYYGINTISSTLDQISNKYKISRQALYVKKKNALKELKKNMKKLGVDNYK